MNVKTAEQYRAEAAAWRAEELRSIRDSDTDGFLSQYASSQLAHTALRNAAAVEFGDEVEVCWEIATGEIIAVATDDMKDGTYGRYFLIRDDAVAARVGRFITPSNAAKADTRARNNAKKGVRINFVHASAVRLHGGRVEGDADAIRRGEYEELTTINH